MSKLICVCGMLSSLSLVEPAQVVNTVATSIQSIGSTLKSAFDINTIIPALKHADRR